MNKLTLWIARDEYGYLALGTSKPVRDTKISAWTFPFGDYLYIDSSLCPDLKWEDEPKEITIEL